MIRWRRNWCLHTCVPPKNFRIPVNWLRHSSPNSLFIIHHIWFVQKWNFVQKTVPRRQIWQEPEAGLACSWNQEKWMFWALGGSSRLTWGAFDSLHCFLCCLHPFICLLACSVSWALSGEEVTISLESTSHLEERKKGMWWQQGSSCWIHLSFLPWVAARFWSGLTRQIKFQNRRKGNLCDALIYKFMVAWW